MQDLKFQNKSKKAMKQVKSSVIEEVFVCVCGKQYQSFPALYLHNKNKHQTTIKICQKETMNQRSIWSGKKKKIIYEFPEEQWFLENNSLLEEESAKEQVKIEEGIKESEGKKLKNIERAFQLFLKNLEENDNGFQKTWVQVVLNQLLLCYEGKFDLIFKGANVNYSLDNRDNCNLLPFVFNFFSMEYSSRRGIMEIKFSQKLTKILLILSEWLYVQKFCQNKAVINEPFWQHYNPKL